MGDDWKPGRGTWPAGYVKQWDETGGRTMSVEEFTAEIAHELAEEQREAIRKTDDPVFYEGEAGWLPDLIDPKKESA